jgi:hypothetical protein
MSTKPEKVCFSHLDSTTPVTPVLAHGFLKEAFQCSHHDHCTEKLAKSFIERINMIQHDVVVLDLDHCKIWLLFESDTNVEQVFNCNPPGFAMMMSMPLLKKQLFKQLHPHAAHAGSVAEHTLDHMDEIIEHLNGD